MLWASLFKYTSSIFHIFLCPYTWNYWYLKLWHSLNFYSSDFCNSSFVSMWLYTVMCVVHCMMSLECPAVCLVLGTMDTGMESSGVHLVFSCGKRKGEKGRFQREMEQGKSLDQLSALEHRKWLQEDWGCCTEPGTTFCAEHLVAAGTKLLVTFFGSSVFSAADWDVRRGFYGQSLRCAPRFHSNTCVVNMLGLFSSVFISPSAFSFLSVRNHSHV